MATYLVSLGSNRNKKVNLEKCRLCLKHYFLNISFSKELSTDAVGEQFKDSFFNQLGCFDSDLSLETVSRILKDIEHQLGRLPEDKLKGIVTIDLDLLAVETDIISDDVFERDYIKKLLDTFETPLSLFLRKKGYFDE